MPVSVRELLAAPASTGTFSCVTFRCHPHYTLLTWHAAAAAVAAALLPQGFLQVRGTGYRKGRKGHPLPNIYRQWCDAKAQPCIVIEQDASGGSIDVVVVDLAPLRSLSLSWAVQQCSSLAQAAGARQVPLSERPVGAVPFDAIPVGLSASVEQVGPCCWDANVHGR